MGIRTLRVNNTVPPSIKIGDDFSPYSVFNGPIFPNCLFRYKGISPMAKITLVLLFQYSNLSKTDNPKSYCWPTQSNLANLLGISRTWVNKILQELVDAKFIRIEKTNLQNKSNRYYYLWHSLYEDKC